MAELNNDYRNPPITECLFDIRVEMSSAITPDILKEVADSVVEKFPDIKPQRKIEGFIQVNENGETSSKANDLGINGFICWAKDKTQAVQFRLDGFTYNRMKPYTSWDACFTETFNNWDVFRRRVNPTSIRSVAVRYINTIQIPEKRFNLSDYFAGMSDMLVVEDALADEDLKHIEGAFLETFVYQDTVQLPKHGVKVVKTRTVGRNKVEGVTPIILDIETNKHIRKPLEDSAIKATFNELHTIKNVMFEGCLTAQTRELFR